MSVTQYIGARYVPLFADPIAWDITQQYEPLTIVYYQGNSYTSKQSVPANIDISNTDYWALTGNYNAQIEQYRAEVQTYDNRITANTTSNTAQDAQLAGTSSSGLKTLIDANTASNSAQDAQLAGSTSSGLKTLIDANTSANATQALQLAGTENSGLKTLIDAIDSNTQNLQHLKNAPVYFTPTYMGDYIINEQFGSVAYYNGLFYCFNTGNYDNTGELRIYSKSANALSSSKRIQVGHANSCAYDTVRNAFWIAPHMTYINGQSSYTTDLYKYDTSFSILNTVQTGANNTVFAVSFDATRNVLCAYDRTGTILTCFEMAANENSFSQAWTCDMDAYVAGAWQDVFCYDGISYLLLPEGTVHIIDSTGNVIGSGEVSNYDDANFWHFGECEGWECDANGNLYMARNGGIGLTHGSDHYPLNDAFVTSVSFGKKTKADVNSRNAAYPTATLSSAAQNMFRLENNRIRSLNQINFIVHPYSTIVIGENDTVTEPYGIVRLPTRCNLEILILGTYSIESTTVTGGDYAFIIGDTGTLVITSQSYFISLDEYRAPTLRFSWRGNGALTFSGTQLVHPTYSRCFCAIKTASSPVTYHSTTIPANSCAVFFGNVLIFKDWS